MLEMGLYACRVVQRLVVAEMCEGFGVFFELWKCQSLIMQMSIRRNVRSVTVSAILRAPDGSP